MIYASISELSTYAPIGGWRGTLDFFESACMLENLPNFRKIPGKYCMLDQNLWCLKGYEKNLIIMCGY